MTPRTLRRAAELVQGRAAADRARRGARADSALHGAAAEFAQRGAAAVWVVCMCALVWGAATAFLTVGAASVARHRAAAAADLGALGAAERLLAGVGQPCRAADAIVARHGGRLAECVVESNSVVVLVEVRTSFGSLRLPPARGRARAGAGSADDYGHTPGEG